MDSIFKCPSGSYIDLERLVGVGMLSGNPGEPLYCLLYFQLVQEAIKYRFVIPEHQQSEYGKFRMLYKGAPRYMTSWLSDEQIDERDTKNKEICEQERQVIIDAWSTYKSMKGLNK
jgi:hypothetical protein